MTIPMKQLFSSMMLVAVLVISCKDKPAKISDKKTIYNKDFNWTIVIPAGFDTVSAEKWAAMQNRGTEAIEKTIGEGIENHSKNIFVFSSDQFNYFESVYQIFDSSEAGNYDQTFQDVNKVLYGTFEAQMPGTKLDSSSSMETVSGLEFHKFKTTIGLPQNKELIFLMYSRMFGNKEFTVNIMTMDRAKEKELLESWKNSKFEK